MSDDATNWVHFFLAVSIAGGTPENQPRFIEHDRFKQFFPTA
jgi:hypothetical protein